MSHAIHARIAGIVVSALFLRVVDQQKSGDMPRIAS
jgi:hypothetical protein